MCSTNAGLGYSAELLGTITKQTGKPESSIMRPKTELKQLQPPGFLQRSKNTHWEKYSRASSANVG